MRKLKSTLILLFIFFCGFCIAQATAEIESTNKIYQEYLKKHGRLHETNKRAIHYMQWGNPQHPTIIWLHGSFSNAFEIEPFAKRLNKHNYNLIAIEYYGHGQTPIPTESFSVQNLFDDINTLLEDLNIESCILGGFSRGAYFAAMFYDRYPDKVTALILEDGGIGPFLEHYRTLSSDELKSKIEEEIQHRPKELFEIYTNKAAAYIALIPYGEPKKDQQYKNFHFIRPHFGNFVIYHGIDRLYGMDSYENTADLMRHELDKNGFANDLMKFDFFQAAHAIQIPTLLLEACSKDDLFLNSNYYQHLKSTNKNIQHREFQLSSHAIHYDQPKEFIDTLIQFLNTLKK